MPYFDKFIPVYVRNMSIFQKTLHPCAWTKVGSALEGLSCQTKLFH